MLSERGCDIPVYAKGYIPLADDEKPGRASWIVLPLAEIKGFFRSWKSFLLLLICCGPQLSIFFKIFMAFSFSGADRVGRRAQDAALSFLGNSTEMSFYAESLVQLPITLIFVAVFVASSSIFTVSRDRQFGALELYFTRPLGLRHYITGRWFGAALSVAMVSVLPVLLAWLVAALTAPSWSFLVDTCHIPFLITLQGIYFCGLLGLCIITISSLSSYARTCQITWIGFTVIMHLVFSTGLRRFIQQDWVVQCSPWGIMQRVSEAILGITPEHSSLSVFGKCVTAPIDWVRTSVFGLEAWGDQFGNSYVGCVELSLLMVLLSLLILRRTIKPVEVVG